MLIAFLIFPNAIIVLMILENHILNAIGLWLAFGLPRFMSQFGVIVQSSVCQAAGWPSVPCWNIRRNKFALLGGSRFIMGWILWFQSYCYCYIANIIRVCSDAKVTYGDTECYRVWGASIPGWQLHYRFLLLLLLCKRFQLGVYIIIILSISDNFLSNTPGVLRTLKAK